MKLERDLVSYILSKTGCIHPFKLSRLIALLDLEYLEKNGNPYTRFKYVEGPGVFFVEGLKEILESDECFEKRMGDPSRNIKGCVKYKCSPPDLPVEVKESIEDIIKKYSGLEDFQLNNIVINHYLFKKLLTATNT